MLSRCTILVHISDNGHGNSCRSKSLGNFFTIRDVLREYHGMALRWFLVGTQYRQPISYSRSALDEASDRLYYVYDTLRAAQAMVQDAGAILFPSL